MSNPTELPDLDRAEFDKARERIAMQVHAMNLPGDEAEELALFLLWKDRRAQPEGKPTAWLATDLDGRGDVAFTKEEAARRAGHGCTEFFPLFDGVASPSAQPEGEAPQAEPVIWYDAKSVIDTGLLYGTTRALTIIGSSERFGDYTTPLYSAAQHAESGAQVTEVGDSVADFVDWMKKRGPLGAGGHPSRAFIAGHLAGVRAAFAAQSQGAQLAGILGSVTRYVGIHDDGDMVLLADLRAALAAQQAAAPGALDLLNAEELAALHRFQETCQDFDSGGYDVDKNMMKRLASIGVIESKGFSRYQFTEFGDYVVEHYAPSAPGTPEAPQTAAARDVLAERLRQVEVEGWTPARDDEYVDGQLASAAVAYAQAYTPYLVPSSWPWAVEWFKPADDRRNLVKAGALIVAEIERLDRAAQLDGGQGEKS